MADENPNTSELWRPVPGWGGRYEVSSLGRVRSLFSGRPKIRRVSIGQRGYVRVALQFEKIRRTMPVHRLVAVAFLPNDNPSRTDINHRDGCKTNNAVSNLEWCTPQENLRHAALNGLMATGDRSGARLHPEKWRRGENHPMHLHPELRPRGEKTGMAKLTEAKVREIRAALAAGEIQASIARRYGCSQVAISCIKRGKTWGHVT